MLLPIAAALPLFCSTRQNWSSGKVSAKRGQYWSTTLSCLRKTGPLARTIPSLSSWNRSISFAVTTVYGDTSHALHAIRANSGCNARWARAGQFNQWERRYALPLEERILVRATTGAPLASSKASSSDGRDKYGYGPRPQSECTKPRLYVVNHFGVTCKPLPIAIRISWVECGDDKHIVAGNDSNSQSDDKKISIQAYFEARFMKPVKARTSCVVNLSPLSGCQRSNRY